MFKCVSFWLHKFCGKWEDFDPVNRFNQTTWIAASYPNRPKSVRNRFEIEDFCGVFVLSSLLSFSDGIVALLS